MSDQPIIKVSTSGHGCKNLDAKETYKQISEKIKQNIISGKWLPSNQSELQILREHKEKQKLKKC